MAATTAWSQQPSPAAAEAEAALRARVEQFYQLQVYKKFRQAEDLVAEESKDEYYNRAKQDIKGFSIQQIEFSDNNTRARVTIKGKVVIRTPFFAGQAFDMPVLGSWKIENGQWVWYLDRELASQSPFGRINSPSGETKGPVGNQPPARMNIETLMNLVTVDRTSVILNASNSVETVMVSNDMPGAITLALTDPHLAGISVEVEKSDLKAGEKSAVRFRLTGEAKSSGVVRLTASPVNKVFEIQVSSN